MTLLTIHIADGDGLNRIGLKAVLADGEIYNPVLEATDFSQLADHLSGGSAEIAIIDSHLPGFGGADGLSRLLGDHPDLKICVLFDVVTREIVAQYLDIGAMGFVEKSCTPTEIVDAIAAISEGRPYLSKLGEPQDMSAGEAPPTGTLTRQQRKVLTVMATGKSNKEIARELGICEGTVKVHVNAAYRALGVHNRVAAVTVLRDRGHSIAAA